MRPFSAYMKAWLYGDDGYYRSLKPVGKRGDYFTAASNSSFFGGMIAKRIVDVIREGFIPETAALIEVGAHQAIMFADMIEFLKRIKPSLLTTMKFVIVEPFEELRRWQRTYLNRIVGSDLSVTHCATFEALDISCAYVVANEYFDAFPCQLVRGEDMAYVAGDGRIVWGEKDREVRAIVSRYGISQGEIATGYEKFARELTKAIDRFEFITFDYGDMSPRQEFSLRMYQGHDVWSFFDPQVDIADMFGRCDLTYDVHFKHLEDAFVEAGANLFAYKTQLEAMLDFGLADLLQARHDEASENEYLRTVNQLRPLIDPRVMGERFKMAGFRKS